MTPSPDTFAYQEQWAYLKKCHEKGRFPHAWIFEGIRGIGKKDFALRVILSLLEKEALPQTPEAFLEEEKYLTEKRHPDFLLLTEAHSEKNTLSVDAIRTIVPFIQTYPSKGTYKIVLIDALDHLNKNAANALLKSLEEPPSYVLFFLIAHRVSAVPITILSRAERLSFRPLSETAFQSIFGNEKGKELHAITDGILKDARLIEEKREEAPYIGFLQSVLLFLEKGELFSLSPFLETLAKKGGTIYVFDLFYKMLTRLILWHQGYGTPLLQEEEKIARHIKRTHVQNLLKLLEDFQKKRYDTDVFNLDISHVLINTLCSFKTIIRSVDAA